MGETLAFYTTNSFPRSELNYENGSVKNIHYGDIHTKFSMLFDIQKENVPYVNSNIDLSRINQESYCQEGDLVIADASEDYKDVGKSIEIINLDNQKLLAGLHTYIARDIEKMALGFKGYLMQTYKIRLQIMEKATGISKTNLAKIKISFPTLPEQTKIADFLSAIDKKITLVKKQLDKTKDFKKGLLQKMFV